MPAFLLPILAVFKNPKVLLGLLAAALVVCVVSYGTLLKRRANVAEAHSAALQVSLQEALTTNAANLAEISRLRAAEATARRLVAESERVAAERSKTLEQIRKEIRETPETGCTTVSPRLGAALRGLRRLSSGDHQDQDGDRNSAR